MRVSAAAQSQAAAILRGGDSAAVAQVIERFQAALANGDTATVYRILSPSAVLIERGEVVTVPELRSGEMEGLVRWARATERRQGPIRVRVSGQSAWAHATSHIQARGQPELINGNVAELIVLARAGDTWTIEAIHSSLASAR